MAAPILILMAAAAAMKVIGSLSDGQQAAAIGARNADVLLQQANGTDRATVGRESLLRDRNAQSLSQQRGAMLQNGLDPGSGSALFASSQSIRNAELDALQLRYDGLMQSRAERMGADMERWKGKAAKRQSYFSAAGQIVSSVGSYMSMGKGVGGYSGSSV